MAAALSRLVIVLIIGTAYVVAFVRQQAGTALWKALVLVIPSIILAGPVPGSLFR